MIQALLFALGFVAGPLAFWGLAKQPVTRRYALTLWAVSAMLILAALIARNAMPAGPTTGLVVAFAFWLAWIIVMPIIVLTVRNRPLPIRTKRIAYGITAAATTIPWFGLYTAQMVSK